MGGRNGGRDEGGERGSLEVEALGERVGRSHAIARGKGENKRIARHRGRERVARSHDTMREEGDVEGGIAIKRVL